MKKVTYKNAGVDIAKADKILQETKSLISSTKTKGSMGAIGGFGGFFDINKYGIKNPLLVSCTDGVGTKLKLAIDSDKHDTVGIDLVAMSVNDCICAGAKPVFFLDYISIGKLKEKLWKAVIKGIVKACKESDCSLLGGETAEMTGIYTVGYYDLGVFCLGIVDRKKVIYGKKIVSGDVVLGLAASGLHSNGYSLVRKMFTKKELKKDINLFLKPTTLYVKPVLDVIKKYKVKGIVNITGGGLYENIPRILPKNKKVLIKRNSWNLSKVFKIIKEKTKLSEKELHTTFNMGIGMVLIMKKDQALKTKEYLAKKYKQKSWIIGEVAGGKPRVEFV